MKRMMSVLTLVMVLAGGPALAQSFNDGIAAFQGGDYETALKIWLPMAERGDAEAQRNVGVMFQQGLGVPQNEVQAAMWYRRAADSGHARAQQNLGAMYEAGAGVPQDYVEAVKWYLMAAERGNVIAKLNLGVIYEAGFPGVPLNVVLAHMWYNLAAAQGSADAAKFRDDLATNMSREQVAIAQREAQEWLAKHPQ